MTEIPTRVGVRLALTANPMPHSTDLRKERKMEEKPITIPYKTIYTTTNVLMAVTVEGDLKKAGIAVLLVDNGDNEFTVVVPSDQVENATNLLKQTHPRGELFSPQKDK